MGNFASNFKKNFKIKNCLNWLVIAAVLILCIFLGNAGVLNRSTISLLSRIGYSIILAVSLNLVVGFLGELSLGHAGFMCLGAYIGGYFAKEMGPKIGSQLVTLIIAMIIGGLVAAVFGFIIGLPALRLKGDYLAIVTLAFGEIVRNVFKNLELFGGAMGLQTKTYAPAKLFIVAFVVVIIMLILVQNLIRSKHGRAVTAIRDNEIAAKAMGINVTFYKLFIFVVSAFFAGIAGTIYAHFTTPVLYTTFSYNFSIEILVMVVLGGMASVNGSIIAATLITVINFVLQNKLSGDLAAIRLLVYALILIVVVIFNNAPALKGIKEKFSLKFSAKQRPKKKKGKVTDDAAEWGVIESKIKMDAVFTPDLPRSEEKNEEGGDE